MKSILLIEPDKVICSQISADLANEGYVMISANNYRTAMELIHQPPNLIILETSLPDMNSFDLMRTMKQDPKFSSTPFFFLSTKSNEVDEIVGLEIGADDYIIKPVQMPRLLARIRSLFRQIDRLQQDTQGEEEVIVFDGFTILLPQYSITSEQGIVVFPKKEFELLVYLAKNRGLVLTRQTLFQAIWGNSGRSISRTIDVHVGRIRKKLGRYAHCIVAVPGVGYRFQEKQVGE